MLPSFVFVNYYESFFTLCIGFIFAWLCIKDTDMSDKIPRKWKATSKQYKIMQIIINKIKKRKWFILFFPHYINGENHMHKSERFIYSHCSRKVFSPAHFSAWPVYLFWIHKSNVSIHTWPRGQNVEGKGSGGETSHHSANSVWTSRIWTTGKRKHHFRRRPGIISDNLIVSLFTWQWSST